jgi:hypothetical protein
MDSQVFASRRISDAFAVVSTNGVADVPILYENRVGRPHQPVRDTCCCRSCAAGSQPHRDRPRRPAGQRG